MHQLRDYLATLPRPLAKVSNSEVTMLLEKGGISRDAQLAWLQNCEGLTLLEDAFAQAVYVSIA